MKLRRELRLSISRHLDEMWEMFKDVTSPELHKWEINKFLEIKTAALDDLSTDAKKDQKSP